MQMVERQILSNILRSDRVSPINTASHKGGLATRLSTCNPLKERLGWGWAAFRPPLAECRALGSAGAAGHRLRRLFSVRFQFGPEALSHERLRSYLLIENASARSCANFYLESTSEKDAAIIEFI